MLQHCKPHSSSLRYGKKGKLTNSLYCLLMCLALWPAFNMNYLSDLDENLYVYYSSLVQLKIALFNLLQSVILTSKRKIWGMSNVSKLYFIILKNCVGVRWHTFKSDRTFVEVKFVESKISNMATMFLSLMAITNNPLDECIWYFVRW
jgi:hypothetical protein